MVVTRCAAGALSASESMVASSVYLNTAGTWVGLAQVNSEPETDSNPDGFIVQTKTAVGECQGIQPITCVRSRASMQYGIDAFSVILVFLLYTLFTVYFCAIIVFSPYV